MRNMLAFFMALLLTLAGLGWYLGWYQVQVIPGKDGTTEVKMKVDNVKVTHDGANLVDKVGTLAHQLADKESKEKAEADKNAKNASKKEGGWFTN